MRGDVCVWWGKRKKKGRGYMGGGGKKKGNKKEKGNGEWGFTCIVGKKGGVEKKEEKKT